MAAETLPLFHGAEFARGRMGERCLAIRKVGFVKGRMPNFLVIGAQKCGTTTLYEDLRSHPDIAVPDKESSGLLDPELPAVDARDRYARLFDGSADTSVGEISTAYTMLPDNDVAAIAGRLLGNAHIFYIVRDPIARIVSHHHHAVARREFSEPIDVAVKKYPALVDNSRYAMQVAPWLDAFGPERVHLIRFEDYIADRQGGASDIFNSLGLMAWSLPAPEATYNAADDKVVAVGGWRALAQSNFYRKRVRPLISEPARRRLMSRVLPKAPPRPPGPQLSTVADLVEQLRADVDKLGEITGDGPWWNLDAILKKYAIDSGDKERDIG